MCNLLTAPINCKSLTTCLWVTLSRRDTQLTGWHSCSKIATMPDSDASVIMGECNLGENGFNTASDWR